MIQILNLMKFNSIVATNGLTDQSPIINFFNDPILQDMRKNNFSIENINNTETWLFRIRAIDYFNNIGTWSTEVSNLLPGHSPQLQFWILTMLT